MKSDYPFDIIIWDEVLLNVFIENENNEFWAKRNLRVTNRCDYTKERLVDRVIKKFDRSIILTTKPIDIDDQISGEGIVCVIKKEDINKIINNINEILFRGTINDKFENGTLIDFLKYGYEQEQ